jgi:hypothetical protein
MTVHSVKIGAIMRMILFGILISGLTVSFGEEGTETDFSSPEATFASFVEAVLQRDQDAAVRCFAADLQAGLAEEWEQDELPDSVEFEVVGKFIEEDYAELEIRIWDDLTEEEVVETMYFVLEEDGWKLTLPDLSEAIYGYDTMGEDYEEW